MLLALLVIAAYLVGAIPFGYLVARSRGIDITAVGSGNIGATNVHRALGKWLGLLVFMLDVLKGLAPALVAYYLLKSQSYSFAVGIAAIGGHCLSPFLKFKGGKGIATGLGAMLGSCPLVALSAFAVFFVCMVFTRYVSLSSMVAALTIIPSGILFKVQEVLLVPYGVLTVFVLYRHRANIQRLLNGTESKFSLKSGTNGERTAASGGLKAFVGVLFALTSSLIVFSAYIQFK
jgi:glycerol-3-phosphate acyltransferase PlsY